MQLTAHAAWVRLWGYTTPRRKATSQVLSHIHANLPAKAHICSLLLTLASCLAVPLPYVAIMVVSEHFVNECPFMVRGLAWMRRNLADSHRFCRHYGCLCKLTWFADYGHYLGLKLNTWLYVSMEKQQIQVLWTCFRLPPLITGRLHNG